MSNKQRAEQALRRFLANDRAFATDLCQNHKKQGQLCLAPNGFGEWSLIQTDTHPLALHFPSLLSEEQYMQLQQEKEGETVRAILQPFAEQMLQAWSKVAFLANEESNPFLDPGRTNS